MQALHTNKAKYFEIQYVNSRDSIVPFVEGVKTDNVLEIGSAEGGVLKAFLEKGSTCLGVELNEGRVKLADDFYTQERALGKIMFLAEDIYNINPRDLPSSYDLVILKDVIEHIHDHEKFMAEVEKFMAPGGHIFFGFPSWASPFGGHQQMAVSKIGSKLPYYHVLPRGMYKFILSKVFRETEGNVESLLEIWDTKISTRKFERLCKKNGFEIVRRHKYLVAPIYKYKFGFTPRKLWNWVGSIPYLNDIVTTQSYYLVKKTK